MLVKNIFSNARILRRQVDALSAQTGRCAKGQHRRWRNGVSCGVAELCLPTCRIDILVVSLRFGARFCDIHQLPRGKYDSSPEWSLSKSSASCEANFLNHSGEFRLWCRQDSWCWTRFMSAKQTTNKSEAKNSRPYHCCCRKMRRPYHCCRCQNLR